MKPLANRLFLPRTLVVCVAPLLACAAAHASVVATNESNGSGVWTLPSGTNLLTGRAPVTTAATHEGSSSDWNTVVDGTLGDVTGSAATSVTPNNGNTVTFALDLSGKPAGYNITSFDSYCTWGNKDRDDQTYMLQYSTVANPGTFITISTVSFVTRNVDRSTHTRLTDNTGFLATGVHSIRLIFDRQDNGYVGYREFVLQDTPTVVCVDNAARDDMAWPPFVGPNLLNGATAIPATANTHESSSNSWTTLTDGMLGTADTAGNAQSVTPSDNDTVTFPLDLVAKPAGYDITSFESYCAWGNNGRDDQTYTLEYSTVLAPETFIPITDVYNHTEFPLTSTKKATRTRVTANGGKLALGVAAVRVRFHNQENTYTGFREFILRDTPLPSTLVQECNATNLWTLPTGTNLLSNSLPKTPSYAAGNVHGATDITSSDWTVLTDGSVGSAGIQMQSVAPLNGTSVVFPLDTAINTKGYNLTSLDTYCAWGDSGRDDQNYTVSYATVANPETFIPIETVINKTYSPYNATHTRIAATPSAILATNVGSVKYDFYNQENSWVGFREFIALGNAVPLFSPLTWSGLSGAGGSATWIAETDNNWKDGTASSPFNHLAPLTFDATGSNTNISIPTALTAASLTFTNDITRPYAFSGQLLTVTNGVTLSGSGSATFGNPVQATGLAVSGTGSLTLAVDNSLTGNATVNNGVLTLESNGALGMAALAQTGGTVNFTSTAPIVSNIAGTGGTIFLGNPTGSGHTDLNVGDASTATYAGSIANATAATGGLIKTGAGTLTLAGANTYSGKTTVSQGELKLGKRVSLYNGNVAEWTAANIIVGTDLTLHMGGAGEFTSADVVALNTGGFDIGAILGLDTSSGDAEISNSISGEVLLVKEGINTLKLSGTNTFTQAITVTQGALELANPSGASIPNDLIVGNVTFTCFANMAANNQFGPNSVIRFNTGGGAVNGKVQLRGSSQTVAGLESGAGNRLAMIQNDETGTPGYTSDPGPATLTIDTAVDHSFKGFIRNQNGGSVSLVKKGTGMQEFVNSSGVTSYSYNGTTTVEAGTLRINFAGNDTGFGSNITVLEPGTLAFRAVGGNNFGFDREISGTGKVVVDGTNAVIFTNNNSSWSGGTLVGTAEGVNTYYGFLALAGNGGAGAGTDFGQNCAAGAMIPSNVISVNGGATLSLDGIAPLGNSGVLPAFAPSIHINESSKLFGGTNTVAFVSNITLNGGTIQITDGAGHGGFNTDLTFVGTLVVGGTSTVPSTILTTGTGTNANASLGSVGLPGTTFQVADVTTSSAADLTVSSILQNVIGIVSPLTKTGLGTMVMTGANTYTGDTIVKEGELTVNGTAILDTNKLVLDGGKLGVTAAANEVVGTLYFGTSQQLAGTYGSSSSTAAIKDDAHFSGPGMVTVTSGPPMDAYTTWSSVIPEGQRDRTADPDGDGFTNLQEYLFGTSPIANAGSLTTFEKTATGLIVRWCQRTPGSYVLKESMTLAENPWPTSIVLPTPAADQNGKYSVDYTRMEAIIPFDSTHKFVRVEATE